MAIVGGWEIGNLKGVTLPQKAQSAFTAFTQDLVGVEYEPLLYIGSQQVNGTNHCYIALQTIICATPMKRLVKLILNASADGKKVTAVSITRIMKF